MNSQDKKQKISVFTKLRRTLARFNKLWNYVSIALFISYGIDILKTGEHLLIAYAIFTVCAVSAVANTVALFAITSKASQTFAKKTRKTMGIVNKTVKLLMAGFALLTAISTDITFVNVAKRTLNFVWLAVTLATTLLTWLIKAMVRNLTSTVKKRFGKNKTEDTSQTDDDDLIDD